MLKVLHYLTLTHQRACKNRTSLHFALKQAKQASTDPILLIAIHDCTIRNNQLLDQIDIVLDCLGRIPGPTQP